MDTKKCNKCERLLPETDFAFRSRALGKRLGICKLCTNASGREHYERYKQYYKDKARRRDASYRKEIRSKIFEYLSAHACVDCGEGDPVVLEFDHVRGKKTTTISAMITRKSSWTTFLKEIRKCEIRCANCHRRRTYTLINSYRITGMWANR
jgi:hypothetical protein